MKRIIVHFMVLAAVLAGAQAQDVFRAANTTTLDASGAFTNAAGAATIPGSGNVAVWNKSLTSAQASVALANDGSWQGIRIGSGLTRSLTIATNGITRTTLTLGSSGIDMSAAVYNLSIIPNIALGASQIWTMSASSTAEVKGVISGAVGNTLTKNGAGVLFINGANNTYSGGTILNEGTLMLAADPLGKQMGTGALTINGGTFMSSGTSSRTVSNNIVFGGNATLGLVTLAGASVDLGGGTRTLTTASDVTMNTAVANGGIIKNGAGALILNYNGNTYTNGTVLNEGTLRVGSSKALGSGKLTINAGKLSSNSGSAQTITNDYVIGGDFTLGDATQNGYVTFSGGKGDLGTAMRTITVNSDAGLKGVITNTGGITKAGAATLTMNQANTYSGGTVISAGTINANDNKALGVGAVAVNGTSVLRLQSPTLTLAGELSSDAGTAVIDLGTNRLIVGQSGNSTFSGSITNTGSLTKSGAGKLTLSGVNTYSGLTTISNGTLAVQGSMLSSLITVNRGATLMGTGSVQAVTLDAGAILSAGNSPGTMTFNGALTLSAGSTNIMQIFVDGFDVLKGNNANTLTMDGTTLFDFTGNTVTNGATFAVLQNWAPGGISTNGAVFVSTGLGGTQQLDYSKLVSDGLITVIPEPATIGMLGLGALVTILLRRMQRG